MYVWSFFSLTSARSVHLSSSRTSGDSLLETCSRTESKRVRKALQQFLQSGAVVVEDDCVFSPERDVFLQFDQQKLRKRNAWQCGVCGKHFASEQSVDAHMLRTHPEISSGRDVCLGDYSSWFFQNTTATLSPDQRSRCLATFAQCFPPDQPLSSLVFAEAVKTVCHLDRTAAHATGEAGDAGRGALLSVHSPVFLLTLALLVGCLGLFALVLLVLEFGDQLVLSLAGAALARTVLSVRKRLASGDVARTN